VVVLHVLWLCCICKHNACAAVWVWHHLVTCCCLPHLLLALARSQDPPCPWDQWVCTGAAANGHLPGGLLLLPENVIFAPWLQLAEHMTV
jgi:hypothetical protein